MPSSNRPRLALLIDGENIPPRYAKELMSKACELGNVTIRQVYGDFRCHNSPSWNAQLPRELGIEAVHQQQTYRGSNSTDLAIIAAAQALLKTAAVEGICVSSGDGHFAPLARQIRAAGRLAYGIGPSSTSQKLTKACDQFLSFDSKFDPSGCLPNRSKLNSEQQQLLNHAVAHHANKDGWAKVSAVSHYLRHHSPDYAKNKWGHASATKLLRATGRFVVATHSKRQAQTRRRMADKSTTLGSTTRTVLASLLSIENRTS